MATITSSIELHDRFTGVLNRFDTGLTNVTSRFQALQNAMNRDVNTNAISSVADNMATNLSQVNPIVVSINNNINNINNTLNHTNNTLNNTNASFNNINHTVNNVAANQENLNQSIRTGQSEANGLLSGIKRIAATYLTFQAGKGIINASDQLTQTQARLNLINDNIQSTAELQQMIFESAQRSRGSYMGTADAVAKLGMQAKKAFANNAEIVAFTEQLNKNFKIAGVSAQGIDSVMLQLTQSMASGKLQGEELNAVLDNAQPIVQHIADYMQNVMGVDTSNIKNLASEGKITADIIKKAMFYSAEETNKAFESMPMTFGDICTNVKNNTEKLFEPVLQRLNDLANNDNFNTLVYNVVNGMATVANVTLTVIETMSNMYNFMSNNWGIIGPIVWSVIGAYVAFNAVALITNAILGIQALAHGIAGAAEMIHAGKTMALTVQQYGLNAALLACPLTWIVMAIVVVIAALVAWSVHTNGLKATWLMFTNVLITAWDIIKIAAFGVVYGVMNLWDQLGISCNTLGVNIQNALGNMKAGGLMILQGFVNGAIDLINDLINTVNNIPGVSIDTIQKVTFGTNAMVQNEVEKNARNQDLISYRAQKQSNMQQRVDNMNSMINDAASGFRERLANIEVAKQEHANGQTPNTLDMFKDNTDYQSLLDAAEGANQGAGDTAKNTGAMKDALEITDEDLKYLRDFAEMETINRYTTAEIKVEMGGINNTVNSNMDLDGIGDYLAEVVEEQMNMTAEGVYD